MKSHALIFTSILVLCAFGRLAPSTARAADCDSVRILQVAHDLAAGAPGTADPGFSPFGLIDADPEDRVVDAQVQPDGKYLVRGSFRINGAPISGIVRLRHDGTLDPTFGGAKTRFEPRRNFGGSSAVALQADGRILLASPEWFGRLQSDGSMDPSFASPFSRTEEIERRNGSGGVLAIAVQSDGRILLGGNFRSLGETPRARLARLNADGTIDPTFAVDPLFTQDEVSVGRILLQPDHKIVLVTDIGLLRLKSDGSIEFKDVNVNQRSDPTWPIALQADGKVLVARPFIARSLLERLNADGSPDLRVNFETPGACTWISAIIVQPDGKILVAGGFYRIGDGPESNGLARLYPDGTLDPAFDAGAGLLRDSGRPDVTGLVLDPTGSLVAFGGFTSVNRGALPLLARLHNGERSGIAPKTFRRGADATVRFQIFGATGQNYIIEATTNLAQPNWAAVTNRSIVSGVNLIQDAGSARSHGFYRATFK